MDELIVSGWKIERMTSIDAFFCTSDFAHAIVYFKGTDLTDIDCNTFLPFNVTRAIRNILKGGL
jgi:hypothetical protein